MTKLFKSILFLSAFLLLFLGCAQKIDTSNLNDKTNLININSSKTISTYNEKEGKITTYYFKKKNGELFASYDITFTPIDYTGELYSPLSPMKMILNRLSNRQAKTIEEALSLEVKKQNFTKLYKNKQEYIIGSSFARDLKWGIRDFNDKIERQEDRENVILLKP